MKDYSIDSNDSHVIVGVSGGPDSMALLDLLHRLDLKIVVAHVNYNKRETADRDESIVRNYCKLRDIGFECLVPEYDHKTNFQKWARDIRYAFYRDVAAKYHTNKVFLAHQLDDYIETLIMQIERRSSHQHFGIAELSHYKEVTIYRPLILYPKRLLEVYCTNNAIEYGVDESNLTDDYHRNEIRHRYIDTMSYTKKLQLYQKVEKINKARDSYLKMIASRYQKNVYSIEEYRGITDKDAFWRLKVDVLLSKGQSDDLKTKMIKADDLYFQLKDKVIEKYRDKIYIVSYSDEYSFSYDELLSQDKKAYYAIVAKADSFHSATISADDFPITVRNFRPGDKIRLPYGTKKLSRHFIDHKIPKHQRHRWPVVIDRNGEIIFVPGIGPNIEHYSIKPNFFMIQYGNMEDR